MTRNDIIQVNLFDTEIGRIGFDEQKSTSTFQFSPDFLESKKWDNLFPVSRIIKRTALPQLFKQYKGETFKGLPPPFADSFPDNFGSMLFKTWLAQNGIHQIGVLEQLAIIGERGMGAIEYVPSKVIPPHSKINLKEIITLLKQVMDLKEDNRQSNLDTQGLLNIFKMGTSPGGARPKILISEHQETAEIIPGDISYSEDYNHYLVKLAIEEDLSYPREVIEYCYYQSLKRIGVEMMESKLIDSKHFATKRFDRKAGKKQHTLTATGMTGWDFKDPDVSSYENLFELCSFLRIPHAQVVELYKRMVFNIIFGNTDDHLKNHSFIYDEYNERWHLSPAYDVTYAQNPLLNFTNTNRALSINGKRNNITIKDLLTIADTYVIKNPLGIIEQVFAEKSYLLELMNEHGVPDKIIQYLDKSFTFPI